MPEDPNRPEQPEGGAPEDEAPEARPGEPGAPEAGEENAVPGPEGEGAPRGPEVEGAPPGPEVEGAEELAEVAAGEARGPEGTAAEEGAPEGAAAEEEGAPEGDAAEGPPEGGAPEEGAPEGEPAVEVAPEGEAAEAGGEPGVPAAERPRPGRRRRQADEEAEDVIPGAHLEPDLVLDEQRATEEAEYGEYERYAETEGPEALEPVEEAPAEPAPVERTPVDLAADARYQATGKRKSAVARVILKPGEGTYRINGRHLDEYFPRVRLQRLARQPLEAAGYDARMDVVARIHGGGVSAQATALRHGVARALVEADPALRGELKSRGYLTRDPRVKERKKAGLKKARKRPQFSKR
jgi:small subunit ribosomal protein S9